MTVIYCARCGSERTATPCGHTETTATPPSQEPCAYCGARPTWPVIWRVRKRERIIFTRSVFLCAACDDLESREMIGEAEDA